uniref:Sialic acid binding Ig-like lectin H n=1 Tax=Rattus norvegicus TaxID=10116 RepID=A0A8I5ZXZ3_RAT
MLLSRLLPLLWVFKWASGVCFLLPGMFRDINQSLKLELNSVTVQEGLCVLVPCKFIVNPRNMLSDLVFGYWYHEEKNTQLDSLVATNNPYQLVRGTQSRFHLSGDLRFNDCSLDIRDAQKSDSGSYFFSLKKEGMTWNFCEEKISVHVTDTAQNSTSHVSGRASPGKTEHLAEVVQVAMGEAAIKFLLLGICFFFLSMRPHEKRVERPATHVDHSATVMD